MPIKPRIIAADVIKGDLLVTFEDGTSALFRAAFLSDVRHDDGNRSIEDDLLEEDLPE